MPSCLSLPPISELQSHTPPYLQLTPVPEFPDLCVGWGSFCSPWGPVSPPASCSSLLSHTISAIPSRDPAPLINEAHAFLRLKFFHCKFTSKKQTQVSTPGSLLGHAHPETAMLILMTATPAQASPGPWTSNHLSHPTQGCQSQSLGSQSMQSRIRQGRT